MKHHHAPFEHNGVRLRLLAQDDLRATLAWRNRDGVRQQFKSAAPLDWDAHHAWFVRYSDKADDLVFIVEDLATNAPVGQAAVYAIDLDRRTAEIGRFVAAPEYRGKGFMRRGIDALMHFAASELALTSVYLEVLETNVRAKRLYEMLGFVQTHSVEGIARMERTIQ
ncbi:MULTISPECIES: GNAT family N-acetyltransferase [unclassified Caballeronia]|uniref:GNAT family N-acetyltransferase n=1 Tax=unclassified Caballeronia TaxID=2646786 RepID=UPI0020295FF0|nr:MULTISPECIES: GNAT family N-acetyltransferase [unclassified Caballeronia]